MASALKRLLPTHQNALEKAGFLWLAGGCSLALISIAASQFLLALSILVALLLSNKLDRKCLLPAAILFPAMLLLMWTLFATLAGSGSLRDGLVKKLWLYSLFFLVPIFARGRERVRWMYHAAFAVGAVSAAAGVIQFLLDPKRDLLDRIKGFMSIWMTFSGSLMLVLVALVAYILVYGWKKHLWALPLGALFFAAIFLSQTRNALLGVCLATAVLLVLLKRPTALLAMAAMLLAVYFASPSDIQNRLRASLNPADDNTRNRIELIGTGIRLI
jgi:MFS family permease